MSVPQVSVIIPTYNRGQFVVKAINSVLNQTFKDLEIIVIDDGSTDNTRAKLEAYAHCIRYFYQSNAGVGSARNTGIRLARGEWLAFLDSDDEWRPEYLATQIKKMLEVPGICMQATNCTFTGLKGEERNYFEMNGSLAEFDGADYLLVREPFCFIVEHGPWTLCSIIIRSEAIRKAGVFDTSLRLSEDYDFIARVALHGPFGMVREALVNAYRRSESIACLTDFAKQKRIQAMESDERIFQKLARVPGLKPKERRAIKQVMSANRRAIGNLLLKSGRRKEARECYKRALFMHPSVRSLGKFVLGLAPFRIG